jgi:hypothetical protein
VSRRRQLGIILSIRELKAPHKRTKALAHAIGGNVLQVVLILDEIEPQALHHLLRKRVRRLSVGALDPLYRLDLILHR